MSAATEAVEPASNAPMPTEWRTLAPVPSITALTLHALRHRGRRGAALPGWGLHGRVTIDAAHLARYRQVCGLADAHSDALPPLYPQVLAYPLQLALVTEPAFPFAAMGLVHLENRIRVLRPLVVRGPLEVRVWSSATAPHAKGTMFDIELAVADADGPLWQGRARALSRGGAGAQAGRRDAMTERPSGTSINARRAMRDDDVPAMAAVTAWPAPADIGRRYARASGDWNPIHLSPLTARLFGFPRAIAHGLWHHARVLAALADHVPRCRVEIDVRFQRPVLLPAQLHLVASAPGAAGRFALQSADATPHLAGRWRTAG